MPGPAAPSRTLLGRDRSVEVAWTALVDGHHVLVEGPAGIGKSSVFSQICQCAQRAGWTVLSCAPTQAESGLGLAALADLLAPLADRVDRLSGPQRAAAAAILQIPGQTEQSPTGVDDRALGGATRSLLLEALSAPTPTLIAIDDAPWLDPASERALRFALRRLEVCVLVSARSDGASQVPLGLDESPGPGVRHLSLGPMSPAELAGLITARFAAEVPKPLAARIAAESHGNPLVAIELARAALRGPRLPRPTEPLPAAGGSAMDLARDAVTALPEPTSQALALAALLSTPRLADLAAAGVEADQWLPAEEAGLVEVDRDRVRFQHATYAAAARDQLLGADRREAHLLLAGAVADPDERARQLAAGLLQPDPDAARMLVESADRHRARGLLALAADLYQRASDLTGPLDPDSAEAGLADQRLASACECAFEAGDLATAESLARRLELASTAAARAEGALNLASLVWWDDDVDPRSAYQIALAGLDGLAATEPVFGRLQMHLSVFAPRSDLAIDHGRAAVHALRRLRERGQASTAEYVGSIFQLFYSELVAGKNPDPGLLDEALAAEDYPSEFCGEVPAIYWSALDRPDQARARLEEMLRRAQVVGAEVWQIQLNAQLGSVEFLADNYAAAQDAADAARRLAESAKTGVGQQDWLDAMIALRRGDLDGAARLQHNPGEGGESHATRVQRQLDGLVAHARGDHQAACAAFAEVAARLEADEIREAPSARFDGEWVESLIAIGDREGAAEVIEGLADRHARMPRPWTELCLARCRLMLRPSPAAVRALRDAIAGAPPGAIPLERGCGLLALGVEHQRVGDHDGASTALAEALAIFEQIGAAWWADRARAVMTGRTRRDPEEIRRALRHFNRPALLAESGLATGIGTEARAASVRELLTAAVAQTFGAGESEQELHDLLIAGYLDPDASHTRAMRRLNLSRTTYYRRLAEATDRVVDTLANRAG